VHAVYEETLVYCYCYYCYYCSVNLQWWANHK